MKYSGFIIFSALSTLSTSTFVSEEHALLQSETRKRGQCQRDGRDNSSQCLLKDVVYDDAGQIPYSDDACEGPALPERASVDVRDLDPWSSVKQWTSRPVTADTDPRDLSWREKAPAVACIAVLPSGQATFQRVRRLVDNFVEQTYEGRMQLIIIADNDHESEEALASFADGVNIKALHADVDRLDLATLYRLGVTEADDADVLARWDWDAWHHRHRLDRQIRAMALTSRPASRLTTWTTAKEGSDVPRQEDLGGPTLVGEKEWMRRYWYPGQHDEQLQTTHSMHFVELDLPKLVIFGSAPSTARW